MQEPFKWTPETFCNYFNWCDTLGCSPFDDENMVRYVEQLTEVSGLSDSAVELIQTTRDKSGQLWTFGVNVPCSKLIGKRQWVETRLQMDDSIWECTNGKGDSFKVGDKADNGEQTCGGEIGGFALHNGNLYAQYTYGGLSKVEDLRKPSSFSLQCEDGLVDRKFKWLYAVAKDLKPSNIQRMQAEYIANHPYIRDNYKYWVSDTAAKEWVENNKPKYSLQQIKDTCDELSIDGWRNFVPYFKNELITALTNQQK